MSNENEIRIIYAFLIITILLGFALLWSCSNSVSNDTEKQSIYEGIWYYDEATEQPVEFTFNNNMLTIKENTQIAKFKYHIKDKLYFYNDILYYEMNSNNFRAHIKKYGIINIDTILIQEWDYIR